jgi:RNA polymerase sigma-70 factor (ECF subfamily)
MSTIRVALDARATVKPKAAPRQETETPTAAEQPVISTAEFSDLYNAYYSKVFAYVYGRVQDKDVSMDIVADVFEKAYLKMKNLRSPESFGSWLFTIARNEVSSHWRKEKPAAKAAQEAAIENSLHGQPKSPEETLLHKERVAALGELVKQLPKREQEIIALKFDAELTNREIAGILATSEVNVRVTIFRAIRKLRDRMQVAGEANR